jgi:tryptophan-rich sensory protein
MYMPPPSRHSLAANLAVYIVVPLAMNGAIFGLGWNDAGPKNPMLPPGWIVGTIWMLVFAGMGVARWMLTCGSEPRVARWVDGLALLCLVYPLYTLGLKSQAIGLAGAIVTSLVAFAIAVRVWRQSKAASVLTACVALWTLYAETALASSLHR